MCSKLNLLCKYESPKIQTNLFDFLDDYNEAYRTWKLMKGYYTFKNFLNVGVWIVVGTFTKRDMDSR